MLSYNAYREEIINYIKKANCNIAIYIQNNTFKAKFKFKQKIKREHTKKPLFYKGFARDWRRT
jgi:hypothetical protein